MLIAVCGALLQRQGHLRPHQLQYLCPRWQFRVEVVKAQVVIVGAEIATQLILTFAYHPTHLI